eukprot:COSAG06_NODE_26715_length_608_cov_1.730845_2_plen_78_part_00
MSDHAVYYGFGWAAFEPHLSKPSRLQLGAATAVSAEAAGWRVFVELTGAGVFRRSVEVVVSSRAPAYLIIMYQAHAP